VKRLGLVAAGAVAIVIAVNAYGAWHVAYRMARQGADRTSIEEEGSAGASSEISSETLAFVSAIKAQDVRVGSSELPGWYAPSQSDRPGWVLVHGAGGGRSHMLPLAVALFERGYAVLSLELSYVRTGSSAGRAFGGGAREATEIGEALRWLHARTNARAPLLYGCSTGAYNVLVAAAVGVLAAAVVADSGFVSFANAASRRSGLPPGFFAPMRFLYPLFADGASLIDIDRVIEPNGLRIPALIVHGDADSKIDPSNGPILARLTGGELWAPERVGHCGALAARRGEFLDRLDALAEGVFPPGPTPTSRRPVGTP